jgi:hypothetical protein
MQNQTGNLKRNLMAGVTLFCIIAAIGGRCFYLHRMAVYHEKEAMRLADKPHATMKDGVADAVEAGQHSELARRYREAVQRPWTFVDSKPPELPVSAMEGWADSVDKKPVGSAPQPKKSP